MKITTEKYNTLALIANDIAVARAAPKDLERFHKTVIEDDGKDKVVRKFSAEMTRAAILLALISAIEHGTDYTDIFVVKEPKRKKTPEESHDIFTEEALAKIPPGKPDAEMLKQPNKFAPGTIHTHGKDGWTVHTPPKEGDLFKDENGRWWKILDGKKRQQKKPKNVAA